MNVKSVSASDAMTIGINAWTSGNSNKAKQICYDILKARPDHKGAQHLRISVEHNVKNLIFTSIVLNEPTYFDIGDFSYGAPQVHLHNQKDEPARLTIGKYCTIGHDVKIYLGSAHRHDTYTIFPFSAPNFGSLFESTKDIKDFSSTKGGVTIGNDVWIGAHCIILPGVKIGDGAIIAAGSVISRDVGPYEIWAGNSATLRRDRFDKSISSRLLRLRWWEFPNNEIVANARNIMSGSLQALDSLEVLKKQLLPENDSSYKFVMGYSSVLRYKVSNEWKPNRPTWVILHGSLGSIHNVLGISQYLQDFNLIFFDLPGCGESSAPPEMSVESISRELMHGIDQITSTNYSILGASFGGTLGLQIAATDGKCLEVVLVDTPMSSKKLWHNHLFLRDRISKNPDNQILRKFALEIYGVTEHATVERDYWYLLDEVKVPVQFLTGDIPMSPERRFQTVPVCLDEDDLLRLKSKGIKVTRVVGGHDLINDNPSEVAKMLLDSNLNSNNI